MSKNLITQEYDLSQNYELETFSFRYRGKDVRLVKLSRENVAKVEAMIRTDSKYRILGLNDKEKSPFWIIELGKRLGVIKDKNSEDDFDKIVENVVEKIDKENGTRLTTDCKSKEEKEINARGEMIQRIKECINNDSLKSLEATDDNKYRIIEKLSEKTKTLNGRHHRSFASKFCHYACFYFFEGEDAQDNFSIYDKYVLEVLPYYVMYYREDGKIKDCDIVIKKIKEINY